MSERYPTIEEMFEEWFEQYRKDGHIAYPTEEQRLLALDAFYAGRASTDE